MRKILLVLLAVSLLGFMACSDVVTEAPETPAVVETPETPAVSDKAAVVAKEMTGVQEVNVADVPGIVCPCEKGEALLRFQASPNAPVQSWCIKSPSKRYDKLIENGATHCCNGQAPITCPNQCFPILCRDTPTPP